MYFSALIYEKLALCIFQITVKFIYLQILNLCMKLTDVLNYMSVKHVFFLNIIKTRRLLIKVGCLF